MCFPMHVHENTGGVEGGGEEQKENEEKKTSLTNLNTVLLV